MSDFRKILTSMRQTASLTSDMISMKSILQARKTLKPQLLHLVNQTIRTSEYPAILKLSKIIPIPKPPKKITKINGWRPVNIVPALSKIIEKVLMRQMLAHLTDNNVISPNHHGSVPGRSTQMLILDLHDK